MKYNKKFESNYSVNYNKEMSISSVFHNEDLRKQIFNYKKIECLLTIQSVRQKVNVMECNVMIEFAYDDYADALWEIDEFDEVGFIKYLHCEHYLDDEMFCKGCGVGLICEYTKGFSIINNDTQIFRIEPEWYEPNEVGGNGGYMCKCCRREFGLN